MTDIRKLPGSKKYPHFNQDGLAGSLSRAGISHLYLKELGGRRRRNKGSGNRAWRNISFRVYAHQLETEEFRRGVDELLGYARAKRTALMCSEAVWWRCHGALVADYLKSGGVTV